MTSKLFLVAFLFTAVIQAAPKVPFDVLNVSVLNNNRSSYVETVEAKLEGWQKLISALREDAETTLFKSRKERLEQIAGELEDKCLEIRGDLITLKLSSRETWFVHQNKIEAALDDLRAQYNHVLAE